MEVRDRYLWVLGVVALGYAKEMTTPWKGRKARLMGDKVLNG